MASTLDLGVLQGGRLDIGALQSVGSATQNLGPSAIGSDETLGALTLLYNQTVIPGGIASGEAFGTPSFLGFLEPSGIGPSTAFGVPTIAGPIVVVAIDSAEAFGAPTIDLQQGISPVAIQTEEAFGTARVSLVQSILPEGIASGEVFGSPVVKGSQQYIHAESIDGGIMGIPQVGGGIQTLQVFIGNYDRSTYLRVETARLVSQTLGRWTADFEFFNVPFADQSLVGGSQDWTPVIGQTVLVKEFGNKWFAGCIAEVEAIRYTSLNLFVYRCKALDKSSICDHRVVPVVTFTADQDGADVVRFVVSTYLNGEGITTGGVPALMGNLGSDIPVNFWYVTAVFDQITVLTGYQWWIDINGQLNWHAPNNTNAAPFDLTETSKNYLDDGTGLNTLHVSTTLLDYRNKQYVVSNRNVLPGDGSNPATAARTETFTAPTGPAGLIANTLAVQLPILTVVSIKVNGVTNPFATYLYETPPVNTDLVWAYFPGNIYVTPPISGPFSTINPGDVIVIQYVPFAQQASQQSVSPLVVVTPPLPPPGEQFGTCGSGVYESVQQVNDITTQDDLDAYAQGLLARSGVVPIIVRYTTDVPGLQVGQKQNANIPKYGLNNTSLFITAVSGRSLAIDLGYSSSFRWDIEAMNTQDLGNWMKFWERLIRRTQLAKPLTVIDASSFVLAPGISLAGGNNVTNPIPVTASGQLVDIVAVTDEPSIDQTLVIDISYNGASLFPPGGGIKLASGVTTLQLVSTFSAPVIYLFKDNLLRISASYQVTGPNPIAAKSVSVKVRVGV